MLRLVLVLLFGLACEALGVVLIARGQKQLPPMTAVSAGELIRLARNGAGNLNLAAGVALEAVFFGCLLFLLRTMSIYLPSTSPKRTQRLPSKRASWTCSIG